MKLTLVSYNIHKCRGMDRRVRPERIVRLLRELNADLIALQEVVRLANGREEDDQLAFIAAQFPGYSLHFGDVRALRGGRYGNAILSRLPVRFTRNYDISWRGRERRGCLRVDVECGGALLHIFNVHLGTSFFERRAQGPRLLSDEILRATALTGPRIVLGDFNEWTRGLASRLMADHFQAVDVKAHLGTRRTYPGLLPVFHLDHVYFDPTLKLQTFALYRTRLSLLASDHLPIVAEFTLPRHTMADGRERGRRDQQTRES